MITEEIKQKNLAIFKKKLEAYGVSSDKVDEVFGDTLLNAPYSLDVANGTCYEGSLLHIVLRILTPYAIKLNDVLPEEIKVNQESLIKVCLIQHLSKSEMFVKNDNAWEIEKMGKIFKFNPKKIALKCGTRSIAFAFKLGIELSDIEIEALTIIDKDGDEQAKFYANPISVIVKHANELVNVETLYKK